MVDFQNWFNFVILLSKLCTIASLTQHARVLRYEVLYIFVSFNVANGFEIWLCYICEFTELPLEDRGPTWDSCEVVSRMAWQEYHFTPISLKL